MKVALVSDLHANLAALKAVLKDMPKVDQVVCAGDIVGYCAEPNEVIKLVNKKKIQAVLGDHDHAVVTKDLRRLNRMAAKAAEWTIKNITGQSLNHLKSTQERFEATLGGNRLLVVHGSPSDALRGQVLPEQPNQELVKAIGEVEADVIVVGHTHLPFKRMIFGKLLINPGSVGQPRDRNPKASYAILDIGKTIGVEFRRVEYSVESTAKVIKSNGLPEELAARLFFGW